MGWCLAKQILVFSHFSAHLELESFENDANDYHHVLSKSSGLAMKQVLHVRRKRGTRPSLHLLGHVCLILEAACT